MQGLGEAIRGRRLSKGLTLQEVADSCRVSISQLSKIENGKADPNVALLRRICAALDTTVLEVLSALDADVVTTRPIKPGQGFILYRSSGGVIEEFPHLAPGAKMQPEVMSFAPGATSGPLLTHAGEEYFYVLEGSVRFRYGASTHTLERSDSMYFSCLVPHGWENASRTEQARILVVTTPPSLQETIIQRSQEVAPCQMESS
ncbi:MAG TPA: helix-turn-helix domain-containing protein [Firmicutes bacterium]|nr:helix-turn-helix domain-containing protein [Bacillota bacterium]